MSLQTSASHASTPLLISHLLSPSRRHIFLNAGLPWQWGYCFGHITKAASQYKAWTRRLEARIGSTGGVPTRVGSPMSFYKLLYQYFQYIWEKGPIGNWSHHVGLILELCSKYEIISWYIAKGYVLQYFWSSRDSSTLCFNILQYLVLLQPYVQWRPLCPIYAKICQYPKISLLLALLKQYVDKNQIYVILWKILTFMKFCGDYYESMKEKKNSLAINHGKF